jgi:hypothetical protein
MTPEERFARIEATLDRTAEEHRRATVEIDTLRKERGERDKEFDKRHKLVFEELDKRHRIFMSELARTSEEAEKRDRATIARIAREEARSDEQHRKAMARLDKTEALLQVGARLIAKNAQETRALKAEVRAFIRAQGNGHRGPNGRGR